MKISIEKLLILLAHSKFFVNVRYEEEVPKVTGMLLELQEDEIIELINDDEKLKVRVNEAIQLLASKHDQQLIDTQ